MSQLQTIDRALDLDRTSRLVRHVISRRAAVSLQSKPEGLEFPEGLRERISYDSEHKQLVFHGFMSSADYYFLRACSKEPQYIQALNELHEKCAFEVHYRQRIVPVWLWTLVAASFLLAGLVWLGWLISAD
jgi:hypothetical protein